MKRPAPGEYAEYFGRYISRVPEDDILAVLEKQAGEVKAALSAVPESRAGFRYAPEKWSIRQVVGHFLDTERVFGYRAMSIARGETESLPGFDEGEYAKNAGHDLVPLSSLLEEFAGLRASNVRLLRHLPEEAWSRVGTANAGPLSPRAAAFIMAGHLRHHLGVLAERYGVAPA